MGWFILGVTALIAFLLAGRAAASADPKTLAAVIRYGGGGLLGLLAIFFGLTGRLMFAVPLAAVALWLLRGANLANSPWAGAWGGPSTGQASAVETEYLAMELDHDSGELEGRVLRGRFAGRALSDLTLDQLRMLIAECTANDSQSVPILEAYLDRSYGSEWRDGWQEEASTDERAQSGAPMTKDEAYEILGLSPGASADEVRKAHRALMQKFHPDQGGSTYLASRINQAKDLLLAG